LRSEALVVVHLLNAWDGKQSLFADGVEKPIEIGL